MANNPKAVAYRRRISTGRRERPDISLMLCSFYTMILTRGRYAQDKLAHMTMISSRQLTERVWNMRRSYNFQVVKCELG